jgi:hypothetical protein
MKVFVGALALLLLFSPLTACAQQGRLDPRYKATHRLLVTEATPVLERQTGVCSGTALGPHALITAEHCDTTSFVLIDGIGVVQVLARMYDHHEHLILLVDGPVLKDTIASYYDPKTYAMSDIGAGVFFYGHAYGTKFPLLRRGYLMGFTIVPPHEKSGDSTGSEVIEMPEGPMFLFDMRSAQGDSGGAIYDSRTGKLIGIVSTTVPGFSTDAYGLQFTSEQVARAKKFEGQL